MGEGIVYAIVNTVNGKAYIGSTTDVKRRWRQHQTGLRGDHHWNPHLQNSWNQYGEQAFGFVILEEGVPGSRLIQQEQRWLDKYLVASGAYNCGVVAASPMRGRKHSDETRCRMSEARQGKHHPFYGKSHSAETRRKISEACQGRRHSDEARRKIGEALQDREFSEEHRRKISEANARPYPAFRHCKTGEIIPAGHNLMALCRKRGLSHPAVSRIVHGERLSYKGWELLEGKRDRKNNARPYPAFIHRGTGEVIEAGHNLRELCRRRGLSQGAMCAVVHGRRPHHKGWELLKGGT